MNWLTLYVVDLKKPAWFEVGVFQDMEQVEREIEIGPGWYLPTELIDSEDIQLVVQNDTRTQCRFRTEDDKWEDPICAEYDKFISIIGNVPQIEDV